MRKNDIDFSIPNRQSIFAILIIIVKFFKIIIRQIWPFLLLFFIGGNNAGKKSMFMYALLGISLFAMIRAIIAYFKFYFFIKGDELIVHKGIFQKKKLSIPFDRVQSINFSQNIFHQVFNIVQLEVDTAGSQKAEFTFDALDKESAEALREKILEGKKNTVSVVAEETGETIETLPHRENILQLDIPSLIKVGVSQNHFRSGAFIFLVLIWLVDGLEDIGYNTDDIIEESFNKGIQQSLLFFTILVVIFFLISFIISLVRTVITHYDLRLWREGDKYKIISGLFTRKEKAAINDKIQIIQWSDNILKKMFGYFDVNMKQAASSEASLRSSINIPGCTKEHVDYLNTNWLGEEALQHLDKVGVTKHFLYRRILFRMLFAGTLVGITYFLWMPTMLLFSILLIPYYIFTSFRAYQKTGFAVNDYTLYSSKGMFGDSYSIMPLYKVQNIRLLQTPYQVRKGIANVRLFTASGFITIPYIELSVANQLVDYVLYNVEVSKKNWM